MSSENRVTVIYKARMNLLDILKTNGYDISEYEGFSASEIDERMKTMQLDMLMHKPTTGQAIYVKYMCGNTSPIKNPNPNVVQALVDEIFIATETLTKRDTLMILTDDDPNASLTDKLKHLYDKSGYFLICMSLPRLQFNIYKHHMVPETTAVSNEERQEIMNKYHLTSSAQLQGISRFDPVIMALGIRPGDWCKIKRASPTAGVNIVYKVCE